LLVKLQILQLAGCIQQTLLDEMLYIS